MTKLFRSGWFVALVAMLVLTVVACSGGKTGLAGDAEALGDVLLEAERESEEAAAAEAAAAEAAAADAAAADAAAAEADAQAEAEAEELLEDEAASTTAGSTECADPDADADQVGDGRAHPDRVQATIDAITQELYFHIFMCAAYLGVPPEVMFSFFWLLGVSWNPTTEVGWELHDGNVTVLGTMSEAYILDDGSLLVATGLTPTGDYTITIDASYGSWVAEDGAPPVFGNTQFSIPATDVVLGDPFEEAGAEPVYDLVAGE